MMAAVVKNRVQEYLRSTSEDEKTEILKQLKNMENNKLNTAILNAIRETKPPLRLNLTLEYQVPSSNESTYDILAVSNRKAKSQYYFSRGGKPLARNYWQLFSVLKSLQPYNAILIEEISAAMKHLGILDTYAQNIATYLIEFIVSKVTLTNMGTGSVTQVSIINPNELLAQTFPKIKSTTLTDITDIPSLLFLFLDDEFLTYLNNKKVAMRFLGVSAPFNININAIKRATASLSIRPQVHMPTSHSKTDVKNLLCLLTKDEPDGIKLIRSYFYYKKQINVGTATAYKADEGTIILLPREHARTNDRKLTLNVHELLDANVVRRFHPGVRKLKNLAQSKSNQNVFVNNNVNNKSNRVRQDAVTSFLLDAFKQVRQAVAKHANKSLNTEFKQNVTTDVTNRIKQLNQTYVAVKTPSSSPTRIDIKRAVLYIKTYLKDLFNMPKNNRTNRQFVKPKNNQIELRGEYPSHREWDYFGAFIGNLYYKDEGRKLKVLKRHHEVFVKGILTLINNAFQQMVNSERLKGSTNVNLSIAKLIQSLENVYFFEYPLKEYYSAHSPLFETTVYLQEGITSPNQSGYYIVYLDYVKKAISEKTQTKYEFFTEHNANAASIDTMSVASNPSPEIEKDTILLSEYNEVVKVARHRYELLKNNFS